MWVFGDGAEELTVAAGLARVTAALERVRPGDLEAAVVGLLMGRDDAGRAESPLVERLDVKTMVSLCELLGAHGTTAAVPALHRLCDDLLDRAELKAAARAAIGAIHARTHGAEGGRLALAERDTAAGGLSIPAGQAEDVGVLSQASETNAAAMREQP